MEDPEGIAGAVKLVARVAGEVEAEITVVVEHGGVDGAIEKCKDGVRGGRYYGGLNIRHLEVVVRLQNGAGGHGGVVYHHCLLVVVDGFHLVVARRGQEEQFSAAVEHVPELWRPATVVHAERVLYGNVAAGGAASGY
ncbi:hypothetical protein TorRG33x02_109700 [Trema orientale]|uniref:Uncharacterized protein n=1 Tax=Trema orientale TaxID=63057 RepID=A0A2P5F5K1_TREOI|nr:hypothetical protein TorRG33x02_109700 [Trema orientale]